jgi:hypothetical protein
MGWGGSLYRAIDHWIDAENRWTKLKNSIGDEQVTEVRYEDLLAAPEETAKRICEFVGVCYSPSMLEYHKTSTYGPANPQLAYQWARKLTARDVRILEGKAAELLKHRGYSLSGLPPIHPKSIAKGWIATTSALRRLQFRVRRYGLALTLQEMIARRFWATRMSENAQRKMNKVDLTHLK